MSVKVGFEELFRNVVELEICAGCGACVIVCPFKEVLEYIDGGPREVGECKVCGICPRVCPRYNDLLDELERMTFGRMRSPEEKFGVYREIYVAKSTNDQILKQCQDGGVVTALLNSALDLGIIDGAIVSGVDPSTPWLPVPLVAVNDSDVIRCSGTRYTYSPNLLALQKNVIEGLCKSVAFVGTPCQISAFRQIQKVPLKKISNTVAFTVGLFCSESFTYRGLMIEKIRDDMGINLNDIEKMNIKGKFLIQLKNGDVMEIPLKEARKYAEKKCSYCGDFSSELADISVGGIGLNDRTFTVVRTELGEKILSRALEMKALEIQPADEFPSASQLLVRLSRIKRRNLRNRVK